MTNREIYKPGFESGRLPWTPEVFPSRTTFQDGENSKSQAGGRRLWDLLWPERTFLACCAVVCAIVALIFSCLQTPLYKARTSLEIEDLNDQFLRLNEVDPVKQGGTSDTYLTTQLDVLSSNALLSRVVSRLSLEERYRPKEGPSFLKALKEKMNFSHLPPLTPREIAMGDIRNNLDIFAPRGTSRVVTIEYVSPDPKLAAGLPNTLANEFIDRGVELRIESARSLSTWLDKELEKSRQKLQASEDALQQYGKSAGLLFTDENNTVAGTRLKQIQEELSRAQADRMLKQATYELIKSASAEDMARIAGSQALQEYQIRLTDLRRQLADARAMMTPTHYKVKQLAAQVAEVEAALAAERRETTNRLSNEFTAARRREALLQQAYSQQAQLVSTQDGKASRYHVLKNEVETNRQLYDAMLQRAKGVSVASAMRASNIAIFDPAEVPSHPYKPNLVLNIAIGTFSGILLGSMFVFMRDSSDRSLRAPGQVSLYFNVPELGAVPNAQLKALPAPEQVGSGPRLLTEPRGIEFAMIHSTQNSGSESVARVADSFRSILASLLLTNEGADSNVIVVTSPSAREGKTSTAANLAVTLASVGRRVLLVDADFRKPRMHEIFGVNNERGFSDLLVEEPGSNPPEYSGYFQPTQIKDLFLMTSGRRRQIASNFLYSAHISRAFEQIRGAFDTILIDTPPILPVADARMLGRSADGVVVVCRAGATDKARAKAAIDRLQADGVRVIGTVLNDFNPRLADHYAGYYAHAGASDRGEV